MITPNSKAFLSPKDRIRQIALEHIATSDRSHLEPRTYQSMRPLYQRTQQAVQDYFLSQGRDLDQWQIILLNPAKFNQVWRQSLMLPADDAPPPHSMRFVLPLQSTSLLIN